MGAGDAQLAAVVECEEYGESGRHAGLYSEARSERPGP